jgi:hypothetical protein
MHWQDDDAMKWSGLILVLAVLMIMLHLSGCVKIRPGDDTIPAPTLVLKETSAINIPPSTTFTTIPTGTAISIETPVPMPAYVKRPFGYVQYTYNPGHMITLQESHVETDPAGARTIVGTIKNTGAEQIDLVVVTANLYNANGNIIGTAIAEMNYLEPGRVWKFRTGPFSMTEFQYHQIAEIFTG